MGTRSLRHHACSTHAEPVRETNHRLAETSFSHRRDPLDGLLDRRRLRGIGNQLPSYRADIRQSHGARVRSALRFAGRVVATAGVDAHRRLGRAPAHGEGDCIAIYQTGGDPSEEAPLVAAVVVSHAGEASGQVAVPLPLANPGPFEARYILEASDTVVATTTFGTRPIVPDEFTLASSGAVPRQGSLATIDWTAPADHGDADWIGLYRADADPAVTPSRTLPMLRSTTSAKPAGKSLSSCRPEIPGPSCFATCWIRPTRRRHGGSPSLAPISLTSSP